MKNIQEDMIALKVTLKTMIKKEFLEWEKEAKKNKQRYNPQRYMNWETKLELVTRVHCQLCKRKEDWHWNQRGRRTIMKNLEDFDELVKAYEYVEKLRWIYDAHLTRNEAESRINIRIQDWEKLSKKVDEIWNMVKLVENHKESILNYFISRHTNWYAEWLNSRIDHLNTMSKWFADKNFMMYKIAKLFS
jgi:hypothetical protein